MNAVADPPQTRGLHRAWWVAGITMAALIAAAGFRSSTGALLVPLEEEFGWSRATTSGAVSLNLVVYGLARNRGLDELSMFSITPLGAIYLAIGFTYLFTVGRLLLPRRRGGGIDRLDGTCRRRLDFRLEIGREGEHGAGQREQRHGAGEPQPGRHAVFRSADGHGAPLGFPLTPDRRSQNRRRNLNTS